LARLPLRTQSIADDEGKIERPLRSFGMLAIWDGVEPMLVIKS
jgi:hypothetical protein